MEVILKSIGSLCIITYISGLLLNLVDVSNTQKAIRFTTVLLLFASVLIPLKNISYNDYTNYDIAITTEENSDYIISAAKEEIEYSVKNKLKEKNISYNDVTVHINKESEGISISHIEISGVINNQRNIVQQMFNDNIEFVN